MDIILIILIIILLFRIKLNNPEPFSQPQTKSINGIFVILVFIRHFLQYIEKGRFDIFLFRFDEFTNQLIVVPFLFFSGYAVMYKISSDPNYLNRLPLKAAKLSIRFIIGIFLFIVINAFVGKKYNNLQTLLAFTGFTSIGNSNWYFVAIIIMWLSTFISFKTFKKRKHALILLGFLIFLYSFIICHFKNEIWFNTLLAYYLGILFYSNKNRIEKELLKNNRCWLIWIISLLTTSLLVFTSNFYIFEIRVTCFVIFLICSCYKVKNRNRILIFLGNNTFEIYLLQRLSMIILKDKIHINLLYFFSCLMITIIIAIIYKYLTGNLLKTIKPLN